MIQYLDWQIYLLARVGIFDNISHASNPWSVSLLPQPTLMHEVSAEKPGCGGGGGGVTHEGHNLAMTADGQLMLYQ